MFETFSATQPRRVQPPRKVKNKGKPIRPVRPVDPVVHYLDAPSYKHPRFLQEPYSLFPNLTATCDGDIVHHMDDVTAALLREYGRQDMKVWEQTGQIVNHAGDPFFMNLIKMCSPVTELPDEGPPSPPPSQDAEQTQ